jgi:hypothetical protein
MRVTLHARPQTPSRGIPIGAVLAAILLVQVAVIGLFVAVAAPRFH